MKNDGIWIPFISSQPLLLFQSLTKVYRAVRGIFSLKNKGKSSVKPQ
ncbi:hypothetical protein HMPREF1246_0332 [Acidaminococcus sp. BV3L6]|uniref:Uncharacterized protein n=1 Tax=Acidaminococcus intestini (strain RyC-MR95) TaxID=568816 RepID=G4Q8E5_ACIIR|nr:hypothetical protein Acin_2463 [Acidaminococcus intestini RyC-MR95]ERL19462.1 hypothetical protein HMPREF1246_0332 [Acidaminococcus sp. BV3L6]